MSFFGDVFGFEKNLLGQRLSTWKKQPERLVFGINTPADTAVWGAVTGKKYEPVMDMWGSPTSKQYETAQKSGINTGPGKGMHDVAKLIASMYVGGKMMGGNSGTGGMGNSGGGWQDMIGNLPMPNLGGGQQQPLQQQIPISNNQYSIETKQNQGQQAMNPNFLMANALRNYYG